MLSEETKYLLQVINTNHKELDNIQQKQIKPLNLKFEWLEDRVNKTERTITKVADRLIQQESYARRSNLICSGI